MPIPCANMKLDQYSGSVPKSKILSYSKIAKSRTFMEERKEILSWKSCQTIKRKVNRRKDNVERQVIRKCNGKNDPNWSAVLGQPQWLTQCESPHSSL